MSTIGGPLLLPPSTPSISHGFASRARRSIPQVCAPSPTSKRAKFSVSTGTVTLTYPVFYFRIATL